MARQKQSREADPAGPIGLGEFLSFGTLFLGVVGVLALAAFLKTESPPAHPSFSSEGITDSSTGGAERNPRSDRQVVTLREERESAPEEPTREPATVTPAPPSALDTPRPGRTSTLVRTPQVSSDLLRRTEFDLRRLTGDGDPWTLQLALLCDPQGVREAVGLFGSHGAFHVLPTLHEDRACFVLAWNRYGTRDAAKTARDLPTAIRSRYPKAFPKTIAEVIR